MRYTNRRLPLPLYVRCISYNTELQRWNILIVHWTEGSSTMVGSIDRGMRLLISGTL